MADTFQIINYEGDNSTFVWKSPVEDFNTGTQLIVHESQEALFFMNGHALDLFGPGRHTLKTQNIPLIKKFLNRPTDDQTPFHCEVYYINKTEQMSIKWGTDSQVQYMEPTYKFPLKIGASGEMALRVEDSRKLLVKIVGTEKTLGQAALVQMFRAFLMAKVKPYLAQTMQVSEFGIFEVDAHMGELSVVLHKQLIPDFLEYGLSLERFFVTTIVKPDGDKAYETIKEIHLSQYSDSAKAKIRQNVEIINQQTSAEKMTIEAKALAQKTTIEAEALAQKTTIESKALAEKRMREGYTAQQEFSFDVLGKVAENEGAAPLTNTGIGIGVAGGMAGSIGPIFAGLAADAFGSLRPQQGGTGDVSTPVAGFGVVIPPVIDLKSDSPAPPVQSASATDDMAAFRQKLEKLKMMKEMGMLSDQEFEAERKKLLSSL